MAETIEWRLTKVEQRIASALGREQGRLLQELQEVQAAIADLALRFADDVGLDPKGQYHFEQRGDQILLIAVPPDDDGAPDEGAPDDKET